MWAWAEPLQPINPHIYKVAICDSHQNYTFNLEDAAEIWLITLYIYIYIYIY
jgi:hypothetical protein